MEDDEIEKEKAKLLPESQRFMETLMSMYTDHQLEQVARSWAFIDNAMRKRRLQSVMDLSVERDRLLEEHGHKYDKGRKRGLFSSAFMEFGIEHLIEGDEKGVRRIAEMYLFKGEPEDCIAQWVPIYEKFRAMLLLAVEDPENMQ